MSGQPEALALTLADMLADWKSPGCFPAAKELRRLHEVEKQRDDLLVVLKNTTEALAHCMGNEYAPVVEARAAIAKATGGAA